MLVFRGIYSGTLTEYVDTDTTDKGIYLYRLKKRRGKKIFEVSPAAAGVGSLVCKDEYEENGTMDTAIKLETINIIANMYYFRAHTGEEVIDEDWYCVDVPPMRQVSIRVNDTRIQELDKPTHFVCYEYARENKPVNQMKDFWLVNEEMVTKRYYFKLYPAVLQFLGAEIPAGGDIVRYTISIGGIVPLGS
jgi:hypothetical protein